MWKGHLPFMATMTTPDASCQRPSTAFIVCSLAAALLWAYWTTFADLVETWRTNAQYSHGFLVPLFALALLWQGRREWSILTPQPSWSGLPMLVIAVALRLVG